MPGETVVVIPCYNEADRLRPDELRRAVAETDGLRLLLVNDGSTDGTGGLLASLSESSGGRIDVLEMPRNAGKAEAVRVGMRRANDQNVRYVGFWDADLATPLQDVAVFAQILDGDPRLFTVFGARVKLMGRHIRRNEARHYAGRVFATLVSISLQAAVYDTQCGAKLFRAGDVLRTVLDQPFTSRWVFDVEILARLNRLHRQGIVPPLASMLVEHPLMRWEDVKGSKVSWTDFPAAAFDLLRIHWRYR
ncbi:MAG TPA: glycosyltransferase [Vicinamibacterales bacterium]